MSARDTILQRIRAHARPLQPAPSVWSPRNPDADPVTAFAERAAAVNTYVRILSTSDDIAGAVADYLRAHNLPATLHLPVKSLLRAREDLQGLSFTTDPPGPDDAALSLAPLAIAETGTLVYPATDGAPAAAHFRPGVEIAILNAATIVPDLETALARIGALPHTVNLVTGPSRTGDIEQTLELGAHGPKALAVFIIKDNRPAQQAG
jgi:L-lactate dehydrogenase complex protein LldG